MKKILEKILKILAQLVLKKYKPKIIGITGSVGKTSTKEAIFYVLRNNFKVRKNIKNYNNEIGVPLSILGKESGRKNIFNWIKIFFYALKIILFYQDDYPEILILEMGVDKPNDMDYLLKLVRPHIGVLTAVEKVHTEFLQDIKGVFKEKSKLIKTLSSEDYAILNYDDERVRSLISATKAEVITYGFSDEAQIRASDVKVAQEDTSSPEEQIKGLNFKLHSEGKVIPVFLPNVLGEHQVYAALAAVAVGLIFKLNLLEIIANLKEYHSPPGRLNLIEGIKKTIILDDTYNASPASTLAALRFLKAVKASRYKWAVLGEMAELGSYKEEGHLKVGKTASRIADFIVIVGEKAKKIGEGALREGFSKEKLFYFDDIKKAGLFLQSKIKKGDILLIKGSQVARMEKIVKELMARPELASKLLVRQEDYWLK